jgi:4-amino-4-deoxy-L-arabinose transferase-like glycosyltransferase
MSAPPIETPLRHRDAPDAGRQDTPHRARGGSPEELAGLFPDQPGPTSTAADMTRRQRLRTLPARIRRGRPGDPRWVRPSLLALLAATALLYLVDLGASGWGNSFYSAAVQAGSESWKAFFFGSSDSANFITVDKPPASLWVMELSVRMFGLNSWAVLVPQALMGVATVGTVYATVRRRFLPMAGLTAGAVLALTPAAALMFRFNNPDALLTLLLSLALYATVRALEDGRTRWLVLVGTLIGFAFLTKTFQAFLVLPAIGLVYLACGPHRVWRRVRQLGAGLLAMVVAGGWWVAVVELVPASARPYIGGSTDNSFLDLTFGYNGFGRLTGDETGSVTAGGGTGTGGTSMWGQTGIGRLFGSEFAGGIAWLLPTALALLVLGLWLTRRAARTDRVRASFALIGGSLVTTWLCLSFMQGIVHPYYTIALAPYLAAVVGMGSQAVWRGRERMWIAATGGAVIAGTSIWSYLLLDRVSDWMPWLRWLIVVLGVAAGIGYALHGLARDRVARRRLVLVTAIAGLVATLAGSAAYAVDTAATAHTGSLPSAGPSTGTGMGGMGAPGGGKAPGAAGGAGKTGGMTTTPGGTAGKAPTGKAGGKPTGKPGGTNSPAKAGASPGKTGGGGGMGGLLDGATVSTELASALGKDASSYTWVAAAVGSQNASSYQLATQDPVMSVGGFNGTDDAPTLSQFKAYVTEGKIHYFLGSSTGMSGSDSSSAKIAAWAEANFKKVTVDGTTLYDLTQPTS